MTIRIKNSIKPIRTITEYEEAVRTIDKLMDAKTGSMKENVLWILSILVEKYEEENFKLPKADPIEAIKFRLDQLGLGQKDLADIIGANRASEIFAKKRDLSVDMMRKLHKELSIPAEVLLG